MRNLKKIAILVLVSLLTVALNAQTSAEQSMKNDYPKLMQKYGHALDQQHAHYIFAVDISSSMLQYESTVKENFLAFVNAIPDGDQVTLIRMADKQHTDFVGGMYRCITLDPDVRNGLRDVIYSNQFTFLRNGHPHDGSDGYKMAELVIEAINTIGSNDLTFVYMFTDFEYWTREFKYQPSQENWDALKEKMPKEKQFSICKYGLELNFNNPNLRQHAIIKRQLDDIFGPVDYQTVSSAAVLSQWFSHTIANVMAMKLNSIVERDWNAFEQSVDCDIKCNGTTVEAVITSKPTDLVTDFTVTTKNSHDVFQSNPLREVKVSDKTRVTLGSYVVEPENFLPSYKHLGEAPITVEIGYVSPYQDEIRRLQEVCKDGDRIKTSTSHKDTTSMDKVWNSYIPLWAWIAIAALLLIIIASVLYTIFGIKFNREWQLTMTRRDADGNLTRELNTYVSVPVDIQSHKEKKPTGDWVISFHAKKYNPLNIFKFGKTGYYVTLKQGTFLDVMDPYDPKTPLHTLSMGDEVFVCSHRKPDQIILQIKSTGNNYKIEII